MPFSIDPTTAEQIVSVTDAVLIRSEGAEEQFVADFCQLPVDPARHALRMSAQLNLVQLVNNLYTPNSFFARYLICANERQRAAVFRIIVEQYAPFRIFRSRLALGENPSLAADRVRVICGIAAHRETVKDTLISLGSFSHALISDGGGIYRVAEEDLEHPSYLLAAADVANDLEKARFSVIKRLGDLAQEYLGRAGGLEDLATAYLKLSTTGDTRSPVMYAGNAIESLLVKIAAEQNVDLARATGIVSRAGRIQQAGIIEAKHKAMLDYLGHLRNAADHGVDPNLGHQWSISHTTAIEYVHVSMSTIAAVVARLNGKFFV